MCILKTALLEICSNAKQPLAQECRACMLCMLHFVPVWTGSPRQTNSSEPYIAGHGAEHTPCNLCTPGRVPCSSALNESNSHECTACMHLSFGQTWPWHRRCTRQHAGGCGRGCALLGDNALQNVVLIVLVANLPLGATATAHFRLAHYFCSSFGSSCRSFYTHIGVSTHASVCGMWPHFCDRIVVQVADTMCCGTRLPCRN